MKLHDIKPTNRNYLEPGDRARLFRYGGHDAWNDTTGTIFPNHSGNGFVYFQPDPGTRAYGRSLNDTLYCLPSELRPI